MVWWGLLKATMASWASRIRCCSRKVARVARSYKILL
jgi:hypothetical protein